MTRFKKFSANFSCYQLHGERFLGTAAYQLGNISSRMITEVKQR